MKKNSRGFTLVELTVAMLILTVLATVAVRSTANLQSDTRYQITAERLQLIREAIVGRPDRTINGQPDINGFVADMGRLPQRIRELIQNGTCSGADLLLPPIDCEAAGETWTWNNTSTWTTDATSGLSYGWRGPYIAVEGPPGDTDLFSDGWGNESADNYGWVLSLDTPDAGELTIESIGRDATDDDPNTCDPSDFDSDCEEVILLDDYSVSVNNAMSVRFAPVYDGDCSTATCSDPQYTTTTACANATEIWQQPRTCSDPSYTTKAACLAAGASWSTSTGQCSDPAHTDKAACEAAGATWKELYPTETNCRLAGGAWTTHDRSLCLVVYQRTGNSIATVYSDVETIEEDGRNQVVVFDFTTNALPSLDIGMHSLSVFENNGADINACEADDNVIFPPGHSVDPVLFTVLPRMSSLVVDW